jgi:hypothetical protein
VRGFDSGPIAQDVPMTISTKLKVLSTILTIAGVLLGIGVSYKNDGLSGLRELTFDTVKFIEKILEHNKAVQTTEAPPRSDLTKDETEKSPPHNLNRP